MPELIEVEYYRRLAERALGREVAAVLAPDPWFLKRGTTAAALEEAMVGRRLLAARRIGKLLLFDTDAGADAGNDHDRSAPPGSTGPTLGLRFGMTGRLVLDGVAGIDRLERSSHRDEPSWDRFALRFADGGTMRLQDPRRLGGVELEPDEDRMGVDALTVGPAGLRDLLAGGAAPLKARLMDQGRLAGIGNLLCDEILWRSGLDPARPAGSLTPAERRRLHRALRSTLDDLLGRGGSHTGDLHLARVRGGRCPRDGAALDRRTIGGRTTYSCPVHQR